MFYPVMMALGTAALAIAAIPLFDPQLGGKISDFFLPLPITNVSVFDETLAPGGIKVSYAFTKNRCQFSEVIWYDAEGHLLPRVRFPKGDGWELPADQINRTQGQQIVPRAFIQGISELRGSRGVAVHFCGSGSYRRAVESPMYP